MNNKETTMPDFEDEAEQPDYETYVRLRSLNSALTASAPWAGLWLVIGILGAAAGYAMRAERPVFGVDPAGRAWSLTLLDRSGQPIHKK